jgi:hypothetical protein
VPPAQSGDYLFRLLDEYFRHPGPAPEGEGLKADQGEPLERQGADPLRKHAPGNIQPESSPVACGDKSRYQIQAGEFQHREPLDFPLLEFLLESDDRRFAAGKGQERLINAIESENFPDRLWSALFGDKQNEGHPEKFVLLDAIAF